ncbi:hypothetical protein NAL32_20145 [Chryseobacterium sp. Ch-15]|uniref:Uncharacterized protein n=1 Tax=Chryseobacterium muglaense TaxID=2893752 RepID=A0A9Q3UXH8_9FLAO|nr:hypothetical protein [Chryseobacterium muglaense]MBD3906993.1 hypothetical protein [Chryseobacterium muglaense]MCC9036392.1 hypothetical protein [Chryseobacterium muglaense]MCM2556708.1 hypothetical protein [Chryseobacterium muglaense]
MPGFRTLVSINPIGKVLSSIKKRIATNAFRKVVTKHSCPTNEHPATAKATKRRLIAAVRLTVKTVRSGNNAVEK